MELTLNLDWLTSPWVWAPLVGVVYLLLSPLGYRVLVKSEMVMPPYSTDEKIALGLASIFWPLPVFAALVFLSVKLPVLGVYRYARWINRDKNKEME